MEILSGYRTVVASWKF